MRWVIIGPDHGAGGYLIANDRLILPVLRLGNGSVANDREAGPGRADRLLPEALWRLRFPIARQARLVHGSVPVWSKELWIVVGQLKAWGWRGNGCFGPGG